MRLATPNLVAIGLHVLASYGLQTGSGSHAATPAVCDVNTARYTLLQQCPTADWLSANATHPHGSPGADPHASMLGTPPQIEPADDEELATSSFMSFEEWKGTMLQKTGQDPADLKERNRREARDHVDVGPNNILDSWGEDGEIALDFKVLPGKATGVDVAASARTGGAPRIPHTDDRAAWGQDDGAPTYRRPKDAGKTCKERFSYASFDGGATILKTSPGAQNPKSILVENKDAYMLFTCSQENKFVIVELSEDILVDTVVLANFEFFSSTIRSFRVSVSDKYPVKMDKWKDIGTYQARNSREIQSFLIENPKIYAKYIRVEFLSHYGKEYYCPVSLLRVHGTRMLDSWKDVENAVSDEDEAVETVDSPESVPEPELPQASVVLEPDAGPGALQHMHQMLANKSVEGVSPWYPPFQYELHLETCAISTPTTKNTAGTDSQEHQIDPDASVVAAASPKKEEVVATVVEPFVSSTVVEHPAMSTSPASTEAPARTRTPETVVAPVSSSDASGNRTQTAQQPGKPSAAPAPGSKTDGPTSKPSSKPLPKQTSNSNARKNATATASSAVASPTIQESFFKSMSKRIGFLEGNVTLLAQYIDEQSKFLQEALQKMERRQIKRVDDFLHQLNQTVLGDMVVNLENQRKIVDRHDRQILALSSQLTVLAGDVGLLKLMMIILIVLVVFLILLVLLSCGVQSGSAEQWAAASGQIFNSYLGSPRLQPGSPQSARGNMTPTMRLLRRQSAGPAMLRHHSSGSAARHPGGGQRSVSASTAASLMDKALPLTPTSDVFDRTDDESGSPTPPSTRNMPRPPPQILVEQTEELFAGQRDQGAGEYLGNRKSRPLIEEVPTPAAEPSALGRGRGGRERSEDGEGGDIGDEYAGGREEPSKPPLTRSPLSELGGSSRTPLPALAEDPT